MIESKPPLSKCSHVILERGSRPDSASVMNYETESNTVLKPYTVNYLFTLVRPLEFCNALLSAAQCKYNKKRLRNGFNLVVYKTINKIELI